MFFRKRHVETEAEKLERMLSVTAELMASTQAIITQATGEGDAVLALGNHSHLIRYHCQMATLLWRQGHDPRPAIGAMHRAFHAMLAFRDAVDPDHIIDLETIRGITDWDMVHGLFWFIDAPEPWLFACPRGMRERYFIYSRYLLCRIGDAAVPETVKADADAFADQCADLVDRHFRDLRSLLDGQEQGAAAEAVVRRIAKGWSKRRTSSFYNTSAPLTAGFDAYNMLSVDYQLAAVIRKRVLPFAPVPHRWQWDVQAREQ